MKIADSRKITCLEHIAELFGLTLYIGSDPQSFWPTDRCWVEFLDAKIEKAESVPRMGAVYKKIYINRAATVTEALQEYAEKLSNSSLKITTAAGSIILVTKQLEVRDTYD